MEERLRVGMLAAGGHDLAAATTARFHRSTPDWKSARVALQCALGILSQRRIGAALVCAADTRRFRPDIKK